MRDKIISFNNNAAVVFVVVLPLLAAWLAGPGGIVIQAIAAAGAFMLACVLTGVWFVLVGIYDELKYANAAARAKVAVTVDALLAGGQKYTADRRGAADLTSDVEHALNRKIPRSKYDR